MLIYTLNYHLDKSTAHKALCQWYFLKNRTKNIIYCVLLLAMAVNFTVSAISLKDTMSAFLAFATVFGLCMVFAAPSFQLKSFAAAYGEGEYYTLNIFEEKIEVVSSKTQVEITYDEISAVFDTKDFICIEIIGKLFPVLKPLENAENLEKIKLFLKQKLQNRYKK